MAGTKRIILGITDLKNLFQSIKIKYELDLSNYALSSFKRRLEEFMQYYHMHNFDELVHKVEIDHEFFQLLISWQGVESTEMFRDPEFWYELKNLVLNRYKNAAEISVWIPDSVSGEELYTFLIVCKHLEYLEKIRVIITCLSATNIEKIQKGNQDFKKMEINHGNYERFEAGQDLSEFFISKANLMQFDLSMFRSIEIKQHNLFSDKIPGVFDLILFRNKMLYYNPQLKIDALKKIDSALKPGGFIAIGIKETLEYPAWEEDYTLFSESEKIYKKILK